MLQKYPFYAYIPAKDVARARQFYEGKLGLRTKMDVAGGVVYEFGDRTRAFLYPTPNAGTSKASQAFWQVDDVEREVAEAESARRRLRGLRHARREEPQRSAHRRRREGGVVQGQRRQHPGDHPGRLSTDWASGLRVSARNRQATRGRPCRQSFTTAPASMPPALPCAAAHPG